MQEFKVGDKVELYNGSCTREGTIVADLSSGNDYSNHSHPLVVAHIAFGNTGKQNYQRFSKKGASYTGDVVKLRYPTEEYQMNIWPNETTTIWYLKDEAERQRKHETPIGYLSAAVDPKTGIYSNVVYTTLEK